MRALLGLVGGSLTLVGVALACGGGDSDGSGSCEAGAERCACYPNHTCDAGLECLSEVCVAAKDSGGVGGSAGADGSSSGGSGSNAGGTNGQGGSSSGNVGGSQSTDAGGSSSTAAGGSESSSAGGSTTSSAGGSASGGAGGTATSAGGSGSGGSAGESSEPNLIKNGDFSQGKTYWDLTWQDGQLAAESYEGGEYCIQNPSSQAYLSFTLGYPPTPSDAFPVETDASYTLSYRVRGFADLEVKIGQASTPYDTLWSAITSAGSSAYETRTHTLTPDVDEAEAGLAFNGVLYYYDTVCFDDVSLVKN